MGPLPLNRGGGLVRKSGKPPVGAQYLAGHPFQRGVFPDDTIGDSQTVLVLSTDLPQGNKSLSGRKSRQVLALVEKVETAKKMDATVGKSGISRINGALQKPLRPGLDLAKSVRTPGCFGPYRFYGGNGLIEEGILQEKVPVLIFVNRLEHGQRIDMKHIQGDVDQLGTTLRFGLVTAILQKGQEPTRRSILPIIGFRIVLHLPRKISFGLGPGEQDGFAPDRFADHPIVPDQVFGDIKTGLQTE